MNENVNNEIEFIKSMQVLKLKPNDVIIVKMRCPASKAMVEGIKKLFDNVNIKNKFILFDNDVELGVLRKNKI